MVKPVTEKTAEKPDFQFKGVRRRKWGKWVSEIRRPNCRERIWLGSYDSPEKAARAFDAALFCLRGKKAKFNFPENLPEIDAGCNLTPSEIQVIAAKFANEAVPPPEPSTDKSFSRSESSSVLSVSDELLPMDYQVGMDWSFLDLLTASDSISGGSDFSSFSSLNDFFAPTPTVWSDLGEENGGGDLGQQSFLWSF